MDRASQVLAQGVPPGVPISYRTLADHSKVLRSTLHQRARGRRSKEEKAQSQQYLNPLEEDVVVKYLLQMSDLEQPMLMKFIPSIAYSVTRKRPQCYKPRDSLWPEARSQKGCTENHERRSRDCKGHVMDPRTLGIPRSSKGRRFYISNGISLIDRSFVLNSNTVSSYHT
jgi:hypothetical protein